MIQDASNYVANVQKIAERYRNFQRKQNRKMVRNAFAVTAAVIFGHVSFIKTSHRAHCNRCK